MEQKLKLVLIALFVIAAICLELYVIHLFINSKKSAKTTSDNDEDYIPSDFDKSIFTSWAATYGESEEDIRASMYSKEVMLEFAEYYHKAKS